MDTYRLKIRVNGGFLTPFQADTIFGGLCWAIKYKEGNDSIRTMLADFRAGRPWFVLSNAYPGELLPKPMMKVKETAPVTHKEQILQAREGKRLKKIAYLTPDEFTSCIRGEKKLINDMEKPIIRVCTMHNQINRVFGATKEGGDLYEQEESYVNPHYSHLSVYIKLKEAGLRDWLVELFHVLGRTGLGKRKSTGKGSFDVVEMKKYNLFDKIKEPNAYLSLSNFVPAQCDPIEGNYKTMIKYGKLGEEYALSENPFKVPLLMIQAGSVFFVKGEVRPFYGQMVENIAPARPEVLQYALAFSVPARLEGKN